MATATSADTVAPPAPESAGAIARYSSAPGLAINALLWIFALTATLPFCIQELSEKAYETLGPLLSAGADGAIALLGVLTIRRRVDIALAASLLVLSGISTLWVNGGSMLQWLNGLRYYFPLIFILPALRYMASGRLRSLALRQRMDTALLIFLIIQAPCIIEQFIRYGAGDHGGGSLGDLMSGVVSTLIYLISFYLMLRQWDGTKSYVANLRGKWWLVALLLPSFFNETKVSFVLLPMYFFFLIPVGRNYVRTLIWAVPLMLIMLVTTAVVYLNAVDTHGDDVFSAEYLEFYVMGDENSLNLMEMLYEQTTDESEAEENNGDMMRGLKFASLPLVASDKAWGPWIGFGVGQFKGGTMMKKTRFASDYEWLVKGTQMMGMVWFVELGFAGLIWVVVWAAVLFRWFVKGVRRQARLQWLLTLTLVLMSLYTSCFMNVPFSIVFIYLAFQSGRWVGRGNKGARAALI